MLSFCGQDRCLIDANGRVKFSPRVLKDFKERCSGEVVMYCLPEKAIAIYPEDIYIQMRNSMSRPAEQAAASLVHRRILRRFGALSQSNTISGQGRLTLPVAYREYAGLEPSSDIVIVGIEIGVEIWSAAAWAIEMDEMDLHVREKGEREMAADLLAGE